MKRVLGVLAVALFWILLFGLAALTSSAVRAEDTNDFVITVKTDNPGASNSNQFTIPTGMPGYNYNVDCNDDGTNEATGQSGDYTCTYGVAGTYTIRIKDNNAGHVGAGFPRIYFAGGGDAQKLLTVAQWGFMQWKTMAGAFYGCSNMTVTATDSPDLSQVTDMSQMFLGAQAFNSNISNWNTSTVTNMTAMFAFATSFNQNIGSWDTSNVTSMSSMFSYATAFDQNLGGWNVSALTNASNMFEGVTLSTANYDALLNGWDAQALQSGVYFHGGNSKFCAGATARNHMIASDGWTISDAGNGCPTPTATKTPTATYTSTRTATATKTLTSTATRTRTATATNTPTSTATSTKTSTATQTATIQSVDVSITKKVKEVSAVKHKYTLTLKNLSASTAGGLTVSDRLPKKYTISKVTSASASCLKSGRTVTCTLGQLGPGLTGSIVIIAAPNGAIGKNCATVTTIGSADPNTTNNKACVNVP